MFRETGMTLRLTERTSRETGKTRRLMERTSRETGKMARLKERTSEAWKTPTTQNEVAEPNTEKQRKKPREKEK
ncbi:hypothetical protein NDU88_006260 [Pleurodeles waltl]|uniref:Uncharacterized protein n=1 Tax=Pleurodeles waltl TaxID=8319 RepID=A0AAV7NPR8_PLEWA|nr:hypothetical protein NDU88_006260 [Pleurodeles waltl]